MECMASSDSWIDKPPRGRPTVKELSSGSKYKHRRAKNFYFNKRELL